MTTPLCINVCGNHLLRRVFSLPGADALFLKISADPHTYQKSFCQKLRKDGHDGDWLMGGSYIKFRIWLDGRFIGCGPFRAVTNGNRMEHTFALGTLTPGRHILAIACRGESEGISAEIHGSAEITMQEWRACNVNHVYSPICWKHPDIYGYFKGDIGPGEYFEHIMGDSYPDNWQQLDFDDSTWFQPPQTPMQREREYAGFNFEHNTYHPVSLRRTADGRYIADFGEERIASLNLQGPAAGGEVQILLGEEMQHETSVRHQLRSHVSYQEMWTFAKGGQQLSHFGVREFRFAEIVGYNGELTAEKISVSAIRAPFVPATQLSCRNQEVNAVWKLCETSIRNTTTDTYTDCFTRERVAYEADTLLNIASAFLFNRDLSVIRHHLPYQLNHPTWPCEWSLISALLFYEYYMETGDRELIEKYFDRVLAYSGYRHLIKDGLVHLYPLRVLIDWPLEFRNQCDTGENEWLFVPNALNFKVLESLAFLAGEIGKTELAATLKAESQEIADALNTRLFDPKSGLYLDRLNSGHTSIYPNMWALWCGIVPADRQAKVVEFVSSCNMSCGLYSAYFYLDVLFRYGKGKQAFELIVGENSRWLKMIADDCTITTEHWPDKGKFMSLAHPWGSYPAHFIAKYVFGVKRLAPGWSKYCIEPDTSFDCPGTLVTVRNGVEIKTTRS